MIRTSFGGVGCGLVLALAACGPSVETEGAGDAPQCDPWTETCEVSLLADWEARSILELDAAQVARESTSDAGIALDDGYVRASIGRYLVLQSATDQPRVCLLPETFETLSDVPTDADLCECRALTGCWSSIAQFDLYGEAPGSFTGAGLLLRTDGGDLYRGRVLEADASLEPAILTIEYEGLM